MKKALSLLLSVLMVLTVFSIAVPLAFAEGETTPPTMKAIVSTATEAYYPYKAEITQVIFVDLDKVAAPADAWDISADSTQPVKAWIESQDTVKILYIGGKGGVTLNAYSACLFENFTALTSISFNGVVNASKAKSMEKMFAGCSSLKSIDLSGLDTSSVTNLREMFFGCSALTELDLSAISINNVTTLERMVRDCTSLKTLKINTWYFPECLTTMDSFLNGCISLADVYIYDVGMHHNSKPNQDAVYKHVPAGLKFHDNNNIGTDAEIWDRFFNNANGAVLVFDYPENYTIKLNPESLVLLKGQTATIEATVLPKPENSIIEWASSNNGVAYVDKNGLVTATGKGEATITVTNTTTDEGITKKNTATLTVTVSDPEASDYYKITFEKPADIEYFQVSKDGGKTYIPVHGGTFEYLKGTELIVKAYGNAISYIFSVNGNEVESDYENRLDLTVNRDKTVSVRAINAPTGEETLSFFERIIQWFRDLFDTLFGWMA